MDESEIARLQRLLDNAHRQLEESDRQREEAVRQREEAVRQREEAVRQREEAEMLATSARPQTVSQYLEACHRLSLEINIVTKETLTTKGVATKPEGRIFPRRIIPWDDFAANQEETWNMLAADNSFFSDRSCPSATQLEYVRLLNSPIRSEIDVRSFVRDTVENAVKLLLTAVYNNHRLRNSLDMRGPVAFGSHLNLDSDDEDDSQHLERLTIDGEVTTGVMAPRPRAKGKGNRRADQFCIYRSEDGGSFPSLAIEYKAPHKLTRDQIVAGLATEIQPERDVIHKDGQGFDFESKRLCAAVITQLFSYMIANGTPYGYVCTGDVFIFLHIPSDPSMVYYSVQVPNVDVMDDDDIRLHRTAVSQVFAFVLGAIRGESPPQAWFDAANCLDTWAVEYEDVLKNIPETVRKQPRASPYKPQRWKGFTRSPIKTRSTSSCSPHSDGPSHEKGDDEPDSPSPTPKPSTLPSRRVTRSSRRRDEERSSGQGQTRGTQQNVRHGPYCSHQCLRGLALGRAVDRDCPNAQYHGSTHISLEEFRRRIHQQLAVDRGRSSDCVALGLSGARGSLFKVRLSGTGYTLVAKGAKKSNVKFLFHESRIYDKLRAIQGTHIPVSLGTLDLALPYYFDNRVCTTFLFLSYAGRPLNHITGPMEPGIAAKVSVALAHVHKYGVLHKDAEPRNVLWDGTRVMMIDFERAHVSQRSVLGPISTNSQHRKTKRASTKRAYNLFEQEMEAAKRSVVQVIGCSEMPCL